MKKLSKVLKTVSILLVLLITLSFIFLNFTASNLRQSITISAYIVFQIWFTVFQIKRILKHK